MHDALMEDAQRMEDIATECGQALRQPFHNDDGKRDRFLWAIAVAVLHLLLNEIRRIEKNA